MKNYDGFDEKIKVIEKLLVLLFFVILLLSIYFVWLSYSWSLSLNS
ncbi:MAG: hypothetical protein JKX79_08680 [Labilibaculum sp.]|nr:hypothetical protein [Labilibaculum sp.]